jgi:uncharacterized membrane protein YfcA
MPHTEIVLLFFLIALIYASVGFGGGSSYLAILALYALPFKETRLIALICNIIVVTGGTIIFVKKKEVEWKKIAPLIVASVPMAFVGAALKIKQDTFFIILGCSLLIAGILLWIKTSSKNAQQLVQQSNILKDSFIGGAIGFLSGLIGIGGGIFLSPLLNLSGWGTARKVAAIASIFILVNSVAGIFGQLTQLPPQMNYWMILFLGMAVFIGGQIGSRLGALKFDHTIIKRITAVLVFFAGIEVLTKHLPWFK